MSRHRPLIKAGASAGPALAAAGEMPRVKHWVGREAGDAFDERRSEVLRYLTAHPHVRLWLFHAMRRSGAIVYDQEARVWRGRDTP